MEKFFIAQEGIQKGPLTLHEISECLQKKTLTWNDYIYDEKHSDWLFLFEYPALTELFNKSFKNPVQNKPSPPSNYYEERVWYILKQNENYGPFCYLDLIQMLQSKTLFEHDFLWRHGRVSWKRLADLEEFSADKLQEVFKILNDQPDNKHKQVFYRRRHIRAKYNCELLIHDKQNVYNAKSVEISAGGASFRLDEADFEVGAQVYLHFKPGQDVPPFNAVCKIVSCVGHVYGVSFSHVSSQIKESIDKFTKKAA